MDLQQRHSIEHECARLSIVYAHAVDFGRYDEFASLFAEDGVLVTAARTEGRAQILRRMGARHPDLRSRHVLTNIVIDVVDETAATGVTYLTLYRHIGSETADAAPIDLDGPAAVGHYDDRFSRVDGQWLFAERRLTFAFVRPGAFPELSSR